MIDVGYYSNIFPIEFEETSAKIFIVERTKYLDLRPLRSEIREEGIDVFVYGDVDKVYGYGKRTDWLCSKGFRKFEINLLENPRVTCRMILDGFIKKLIENGFYRLFNKGRSQLIKLNDFKETSDGMVRIYKGYDIRIIYIFDRNLKELIFGLIIDVIYSFKDRQGEPLNPHEIVNKFGNETLKEVRIFQGDLISTGINTEVSRQRFEEILSFIKKFSRFMLPCGINATVKAKPLRIILGEKDESIW
jgi:hypothetical protein